MLWTRRQFLAASIAAAAAQPKPPLNFVFILIDDLGWRDLGVQGSRFYETPNIDRLAAQGMRFTNAYAACPVCSPTRASILTGRYPVHTTITDWIPGWPQWPQAKLRPAPTPKQLPLNEVTLAEALKPLGYRSASIGKWHLGGDGFSPLEQGFDVNVGGTSRGSPGSYFGPFNLPGLQDSETGEYITDRLSVEANKFLEANRDRPFFLYLPEFAVHVPLQAKQQLIAKYEAKAKAAGTAWNATYAAMIESVDQGIGEVMKKLDSLGIAGRTVVFFMSDNGGVRYEGREKKQITDNAPLRAGKGHLYEGGIREPMFVRWPGVVQPGSVSDAVVSSIDFFPTILEMAGAKPLSCDGVSLVPVLKQAGNLERDEIYWHYPHYNFLGGVPAGAIRSGGYKLIEFFEDGRLELYNLLDDVGECKNLARREPRKTAELHKKLKRWREAAGAKIPPSNPGYVPAKADPGLTGAEPATPPL